MNDNKLTSHAEASDSSDMGIYVKQLEEDNDKLKSGVFQLFSSRSRSVLIMSQYDPGNRDCATIVQQSDCGYSCPIFLGGNCHIPDINFEPIDKEVKILHELKEPYGNIKMTSHVKVVAGNSIDMETYVKQLEEENDKLRSVVFQLFSNNGRKSYIKPGTNSEDLDCNTVGIAGGCGCYCPVFSAGKCEAPEGALDFIDEQIECFNDLKEMYENNQS